MASTVQIANRALQMLGAKSIVSLTEDSRNARSINTAFESVKLSELRKHAWNFSIERASLAASTTSPTHTRSASFPMPSNLVRLLSPDPEVNYNDLDWVIEGRNIITNDTAPLLIRFVADVTDPNQMDPLFREALAAKLAMELAEEITQSNSKKADAKVFYDETIDQARRVNAFEKVAAQPPEDSWVTVRS